MRRILVLTPLIFSIMACSSLQPTQTLQSQGQLYFNGDIVTMVGDQPQYAQSVLVQNGKIAFVGNLADAKEIAPQSQPIDLNGKTLLPGFVDAHGHAYNAGFQALAANLLAPPDGNVKNIDSLIQNLNQWKTENKNIIAKYKWIIGFGYDDAQLKEQRHPTADDLDKVSKDDPMLVIHQSGHLGAMNHKAMDVGRI